MAHTILSTNILMHAAEKIHIHAENIIKTTIDARTTSFTYGTTTITRTQFDSGTTIFGFRSTGSSTLKIKNSIAFTFNMLEELHRLHNRFNKQHEEYKK
jgi:hypothetical protein